MPTREQVFQALFALYDGKISGVAYYSRRFMLPQQLGASQYPAAMQWEQPEKTLAGAIGTPSKRTWHVWIVLAVSNKDKSVAGATLVNPLVDQVETLLAGVGADKVRGVQTLGGLVQACRINGDIIKETGDTDADGLGGAVIPVEIIVP